jgi:hypothetical protein
MKFFAKMSFAIGALAALGATASLYAQSGIRSERVQFAKGTSSKVIKASIKGDATVDYLVGARAGQTLTVSFVTSNTSAYFNVLPPASGQALFVGSVSGNSFRGAAPATGDYRIRVYLMRNAARRNETANYTLTIGASGAATAPHASHDATVAGTPYHATAKLGCAMGDGKPMTQCEAGAIRERGGNATVRVVQPSGTERVIKFSGGRAVSADGPPPFSARRIGDMSLVSVGRETYEIPDAFIVGG